MIKQFVFNHYEVNCYVVAGSEQKACAIVDPACTTEDEFALLTDFIARENLTPTHILLTHAHVDHIAGLPQVCRHYNLPVSMHNEGVLLLSQVDVMAPMMGFSVKDMSDLKVVSLRDGEKIMVGSMEIECRYVPGHCIGSLCFVIPSEQVVLTGDALFHFSIGRTDLPGGDYGLLVRKIKEQLLTLDDDYTVLPGHGISSRIFKERRYNPFLT